MIAIQHFQFGYGRRTVFEQLNFEVQPGCIYGLLGSNGTGKSTLLRNIAGLLFADKGSITVFGHNPRLRQPAFLAQLFFLPEEFEMPKITIDQYLKCNACFYPHFDEAAFRSYIQEFAIPAQNKLHEMSYGQKKKVLISFALAANTAVLLMDEPTNGLDILSKSQFRRIMARVMTDDKCIIISTHQVKDLENLIDRVAIIHEKELLFDKPVAEIAARLRFCLLQQGLEDGETVLYKEESFAGNAGVVINQTGEEGMVDLELLYKAVMLDPPRVNQQFLNA